SSETTPGYDTASDPISGLTVTGSTLTWEGEAETTVYVYLVDASGNAAAALTLTFPAVDKTPPTATVEYVTEHDNLAEPPVRAYLVPNSNDASDFTVLDTGNLTLDEDEMSSHKGQYYYNFTTNGSYTFRFSDAAGNVATVTATVHSIDTTEPEVGSIQWLNRSISYTDAAWETAQSSLHTNAPVTAILTLNTQLKGVTVQGGTTDVTTSFMANQAQVTFSANTGEVKLTLTARNGQTTEITLDAVTCIDTAAPGVTVSGDGVTKNSDGTYTVNGSGQRSVTLTFTTSEDTAADRDSSFGTTHTYTAARNGEVSLTFTDRAGNVTQVTLDIQDLDDKLALSFSLDENGTGAVIDQADLELQTGQIFYVKSTRNVTVTLGTDTSKSVTKDSWTAFTLPSTSGLVVLKAVDADQNTLYAYLTVALPDTVAPIISLPSQTVYAPVGTENLDLLREGVTVTDNKDSSLSFTVDTTGVTWSTPGSYTVTYTAADNAQNKATVTRTLVLTQDAPIGLTVNGQTVYQGSTLTLGKGTASMTLTGVNTPVYLALKQGYKTAAQMKLNAQVLLNGSYTGALSASLNTTGFYTLYLRTQDRTEYVFYLYVKG
uniref:immunoglobulin-like domain-containing protein n=1 Tax=uncultured Flavonifractor sp. TaxID=1193534 RepID=UPI0026350E59